MASVTILPQARLAVESALASYRVGRADLLSLLDSQMSLYSYGIGRAVAEIEQATGLQVFAFPKLREYFVEMKLAA